MVTHSVEVSVRFKPASGSASTAEDTVKSAVKEHKYPAHVITGSDQALAYDKLTGRLFEQLSKGYSCTILAYGQTGSGKTHTMFGPPGSLTEAALATALQQGRDAQVVVPDSWGLFPRAMLDLLAADGVKSLHVSAVEIYMDVAYDLLADKAILKIGKGKRDSTHVVMSKVGKEVVNSLSTHCLGGLHPASCDCHTCFKAQEAAKLEKAKARAEAAKQAAPQPRSTSPQKKPWDVTRKKRSVFGAGGSAEPSFDTVGEKVMRVEHPQDIAKIARVIESERVAHEHNLNARSSRSHCILKVHLLLESDKGMASKRQFLFVDLAGSERVSKSGAEGARLAEATNINTSLTTLARVISALGSNTKKGAAGFTHVPFRESTLTLLLRNSFEGKSCTSVVINCSSDPEHRDETQCSLRFGSRVAVVRTEAAVEAVTDVGEERRALQAQLEELRAREAELVAKGQHGHAPPDWRNPTERASLLENMRRMEEYKAELKTLDAEIIECKGRGEKVPASLAKKAESVRKLHENVKDLAERQKTIPRVRGSAATLWSEPTVVYTRVVTDIADLEHKISMLEI